MDFKIPTANYRERTTGMMLTVLAKYFRDFASSILGRRNENLDAIWRTSTSLKTALNEHAWYFRNSAAFSIREYPSRIHHTVADYF
jgi:hypothetical protein